MLDQIIDDVTAHRLHAAACRTGPRVGWIVMRGLPDYPGKVVARLTTDAPSPYVLTADTLAEMQAKLPPGLVRTPRQLGDPPDLMETWFST